MNFITALESELNTTETANGAKAYKSTENKCLDFFGCGASSRYNTGNAKKLFLRAYKEDPETAIRILFYIRDIRGGQGERDVFRVIFKELIELDPKAASRLLWFVPEYGRWDDLLVVEDTQLWDLFIDIVKKQFILDNEAVKFGTTVSLMAKWLPSINSSSKNSKRIGRKIAKSLGWSEKTYRKELTKLRSYIKIVEQKMCANEWNLINYEQVPSKAAMMYRKAFGKHDYERYLKYLEDVKNGNKKINASTLFPYDIVTNYLYKDQKNDDTINLQWNSLPNYMEGVSLNGLVVADVSGSMWGMPLAVSISLAMYVAERNTGIWKDKFMTFSQEPSLEEIIGSNIGERIRNLENSSWGYNTNLQKVFDLILQTGIKNNISPQEMPQRLIIVSDMQFDVACHDNKLTNFEEIKRKYKEHGYEIPFLVFWNVESRDNVPMKFDDTGTCLVSGCSPSILKSVLKGNFVSPIEIMRDVVYNSRYDPVGEVLK